MGVISRMSTIFKAKINKALDSVEDPRETLELSYQKQLEMLQQVRRSLADVVAGKKRLELQGVRLKENLATLDDQAKQALQLGREDLARAALERKAGLQAQLDALQPQIDELAGEQQKMELAEQRLSAKVDAFRTQKEVIKAQYSSAEAQVKIGQAATGLSEEMTDVGLAVQRAQDKTESMKARAAAIDELTADGALPDFTKTGDPIADELRKAKGQVDVDAELAKLKAEVGGKQGGSGA
jgi:phage shock protein A